MSISAFAIFLLLLNVSLFPTSDALNQEGLSLLSWLSTFNSSPSSSFFSSWNQADQNPCQWAYIKCSNNGFISEIEINSIHISTTFPLQILSFNSLSRLILSEVNLTGEIPNSIGNLSSLITLDLGLNYLTGKIPPEIAKLSQLQTLSLNLNSLEGEIPTEIGNCSNICRLEIFDNKLFGKIPIGIGQLSSLKIFRAGGNARIYGEIPMEISNCKGLVFLGLADTRISGQIPSTIGKLKYLKTLSIYTANLTGKVPPEIGNCSALENLFLYENQILGNIPAELGLLTNLKRTLLWQNNLTGIIPESIGNCSSLMVIDFSLNSLSGEIPQSIANIAALEELLLSGNTISGKIPPFVGNFSLLKQLQLDNNRFSGEIPPSIGKLKELSLFFAWQNQLHGSIPIELGNCDKLQELDLSHNFLTGSVPNSLFNLKNLTKLMLISNGLSGKLPNNVGNCTSLIRLRLGSNRFTGQFPMEIGSLGSLSFLELSGNQFTREIPEEVGNCTLLEMVDLHENELQGMIPTSFKFLVNLNVLDLSINLLSGPLPQHLGNFTSLNKLILSQNYITGTIPHSLGLCRDLQLLDISSNSIAGSIPSEIGQLQELDILLNLSRNSLLGSIPKGFSNLSKLANLDLSHNMLTGSLSILGDLDNLVTLDISYNNFSGFLPNTSFFRELPDSVLFGNQELCISGKTCHLNKDLHGRKSLSTKDIGLCIVLSTIATTIILILGLALTIRTRRVEFQSKNDEEENGLEWDLIPFQKLTFSLNEITSRLIDSNIIGQGCSGVVYRVETPTKQVIAVKKLWPVKKNEFSDRDLFRAEVETLGSIRHKKVVRLLGCCRKGTNRLLLFDYISNGSLAGIIHEKKIFLDWDARYKIIVGAADGLAYLHHDCIPPIVHRDIKANNILVGPQFEAFLADFGLAKVVECSLDCSRDSNTIAGSYGYIAPEYGCGLKITEKSDVYSYGVVLLEILTGLEPIDRRIPDGAHIVTWVNNELQKSNGEFTSIFDHQLLLHSSTQIQEMSQVFGVALLCVNPNPNDRPKMKDVTLMLKEIKHEKHEIEKSNLFGKGVVGNQISAVVCSSFSRSSEPLIGSPSFLP